MPSSVPQYVNPEFVEGPLQPLMAGKTGLPEYLASGGVKAVGKIVFTGNLIAGDTVTINGVVFTCMASGAAGELQFDVDASLSASLDALITKLNACTDVLVSRATYTKTDTNTAVTWTSDNYGTADNSVVLASTHSTVVVTQPVGGQDKPDLSMLTESTEITNAAGTEYYTLPAGDTFQRKTILNSGAGTAIVLGDFTSTNVQVTLTQNQYISLQYLGGEWKTVVNTGTLA